MTREIPLTQGQVALVDDADFALVARFNWYACQDAPGRWYAQTNVGRGASRTVLRMHKLLMPDPPQPGLLRDHINGNGLDNRRENLRWVTHSQNGMNRRDRRGSSQYRGVRRSGRGWEACLRLEGRRIYLGRFVDEVEAARAWDREAAAAYGEYAALNFAASSPGQAGEGA